MYIYNNFPESDVNKQPPYPVCVVCTQLGPAHTTTPTPMGRPRKTCRQCPTVNYTDKSEEAVHSFRSISSATTVHEVEV